MTPESRTLSAVVDSNVFVSSLISERSSPYVVVRLIRSRRIRLIVSDAQIMELRDVLSRPSLLTSVRVPSEHVSDLLDLLEHSVQRVEPLRQLPVVVRDPKDGVILGTALAGDSDFLISGDKDLLVLAGDPQLGRLRIVTAREFLDIIEQP